MNPDEKIRKAVKDLLAAYREAIDFYSQLSELDSEIPDLVEGAAEALRMLKMYNVLEKGEKIDVYQYTYRVIEPPLKETQ